VSFPGLLLHELITSIGDAGWETRGHDLGFERQRVFYRSGTDSLFRVRLSFYTLAWS
jgi:hypothetical protein